MKQGRVKNENEIRQTNKQIEKHTIWVTSRQRNIRFDGIDVDIDIANFQSNYAIDRTERKIKKTQTKLK